MYKEENENLKIVFCKNCGEPEYWGEMVWKDGKTYCRECIYKMWDEEYPDIVSSYNRMTFPDTYL